MSHYESIGEVCTRVMIRAAEIWPKPVGLQSSLAFDVKKYQLYKAAGKEVGGWFCEEEQAK